jgi:hypothetical protein
VSRTQGALVPPYAGRGAMAHLMRDALGGAADSKARHVALDAAVADGAVNVTDAAEVAHLAHTFAHVVAERPAVAAVVDEAEELRAHAVGTHQQLHDLALALHRAIEGAYVRGVVPLTLALLERRETLGCHDPGTREASAAALEHLGVTSLAELPPPRWREAFAALCEAQAGADPGSIYGREHVEGVWVGPLRADEDEDEEDNGGRA